MAKKQAAKPAKTSRESASGAVPGGATARGRHAGMTEPLRAPDGPEVAELVARAFRKAMENFGRVP